MMRRMGIKQQQIDAQEVVIKCEDSVITITNPTVIKINLMGQDTFQITGNVSKAELDSTPEISEEDIATVVSQTGVSKEVAKRVLEENQGDIAKTIIQLKKG
ncbi:nascent polypeptide-associated complex protein [Candidatus Woesearchaeota archaeon]|nr:nascent polypeptide-associated complex protein [Candidatus Woesearchaeota archaeon]